MPRAFSRNAAHRACLLALGATLSTATTALAQDALTIELKNVDGATVGEVTLTPAADGVLIDATLDGLSAGPHAFHLHERADCDPATGFKSAGGHIAGEREHGFLVTDGPHPGDMPNVHVPESGKLRVEVYNGRVSLGESGAGGLLDADGSALLLHVGADDYTSQSAGDAGERVACAEIGGS